eukprot:scaffold5357_cov208-Amphora_coffeaeformis.AAC.23
MHIITYHTCPHSTKFQRASISSSPCQTDTTVPYHPYHTLPYPTMKTSMILTDLYDANNKAAVGIKLKEYSSAFQTALGVVQKVSVEAGCAFSREEGSDTNAPFFVNVQPVFSANTDTNTSAATPERTSDYLFSYPFEMTSIFSEDILPTSRFHVKAASAVTMFNAALASHLESLHDSTDRIQATMLLFGSSRLYEGAAELLQDYIQQHPDEFLLQVYLAVCSNMIHVGLTYGNNVALVTHWKVKLRQALQRVPNNEDGQSPLVKYFGRGETDYFCG